MPSMNSLELETEIEKMARAMMTRNRDIGRDLIVHLQTQLPVDAVAGLMIVSIERVIWFDTDSVFWTIENLIPADVMEEIHRITSFAFYKLFVSKGFLPGKDFSVDANGKLLLKEQLRTAVLSR